ncbi:hypothetical protein SAMN05444374_101431 [Rhodococcoides kroppenstedtii]|uniref:Uncharacterized protein n=1 Tax=Rhodococcoides kroppenstedtii TaxID=293050 RepID=A0A1I0SKP5_9NOCA|nr:MULTISPECIES: hypothetical protein [Rhodococcus]MBY6352330.1 hypothetical protein [Rhodococcus corynebacterioides]SFA40069.1 hypothetical protein SAMN05444374_101431 [Rhodococcus kroppenstedtii]
MTAAMHGERSTAGAPARWAWLVLASIVAIVAAVGVVAGSIREYQVSSCEIIDATATCMMSTLDIVGWGATAVVVGAALLCAVPALWPRPAARWGSVAALVLLGVGSLIMLGRIGFSVVAVALLGAVLAAAQGWHTSRRRSIHVGEIEVPLGTLLGRSVGPNETNGSS